MTLKWCRCDVITSHWRQYDVFTQYVPAGNLVPLAPRQYSNPPLPNILNLPTPMYLTGHKIVLQTFSTTQTSQITLSAEGTSDNRIKVKLNPDIFGFLHVRRIHSLQCPDSDVWKIAPGEEKRAMMALNRSPEFKSLNPKPRAAELFGTWGQHLSKLRKAQLFNPLCQFSSIWAKRFWNRRFFFILPMYFYASNPRTPRTGPWFEQTW